MWSISCCLEGKGSISTIGVGLDFKTRRFHPDEDTPLKNGHHRRAGRDILIFFSPYRYCNWLVLESPVGFQVFYSYFYPSFYCFSRFEYSEWN